MELQDVKEQPQAPDSTSLFVRAVDHHRAGRLRDADGFYRQVLARDPKHIRCLYNLGLLSIQRGHPAAAVALIEKAIALGGRDPEWHYNLAFALRGVGRVNDAITQYERAIVLKPDYVEAMINLGNALKECQRPTEAAQCYQRAIGRNPLLTEGHYNLANVLAEQSEWDGAVEAYARAISLKPDFAEAHNNLATVLGNQGRHAEAVAHYQRALALDPNLVEACVNIGKIWAQEGRFDDAIAQYRRALALKPDFVQAHNNLSVALVAKGDVDAAMGACRSALTLNPGLAEAHDNLGIMLLARGNTREAIHAFERALAAKPDFIEAYNNLARACLAERKIAPALTVLRRALAIRETSETKALFVDCLKDVLNIPDAAPLRPLVVRALSEPWGRQSDIARFSAQLILLSKEIGAAVARALEAWPNPLPFVDLLRPSERKALVTDPLFASLLDCGHVPNTALERFLTLFRSAILKVAVETAEPNQIAADELPLCCALARLCFRNDYVFACSDADAQAIQVLYDRISAASQSGAPIPPLWLVAIGAYVPLHAVPGVASLRLRSWPQAVTDLLDLQVGSAEEEQKLQDSLPRLTPIEDRMSKLIRQQYEENPYPRWVKPAPTDSYATFDEYLRRSLKCAAFAPLGKRNNVDVLVAGCGTGQHPTEVARRVKCARILAVDLSLTSLAYAKRQALALGVDNIEYAQADIIELASLNRSFDVIESAGVLHHLPDPDAGSRVLVSLLRPGGFLFLALYSDIARRDIAQVRDFIAARGYRATAEDIRRCRQDLMDAPVGTPQHNVTQSVDFYSTSECRDLLFHVQEQRTTLPEIKAFLAANSLQFLGFEIDPWTRQRFVAMFPDDVAMVDLDRWHAFELEHPRTFSRMYQFWAQKMPDR